METEWGVGPVVSLVRRVETTESSMAASTVCAPKDNLSKHAQ